MLIRPQRVVLTGGGTGVDTSAVPGGSGCGRPGSGVVVGDAAEAGSSVSAGLKAGTGMSVRTGYLTYGQGGLLLSVEHLDGLRCLRFRLYRPDGVSIIRTVRRNGSGPLQGWTILSHRPASAGRCRLVVVLEDCVLRDVCGSSVRLPLSS